MSIQSQIDRIKTNIGKAYMALYKKGASLPEAPTSDGLAAAITSIEVGVDTSDADATASDIAVSKTAYVNGEKITGTIAERVEGAYVSFPAENYGSQTYVFPTDSIGGYSGSLPAFYFNLPMSPWIFRKGSFVRAQVPKSFFGDATAADVAKGKTFSSSAGLQLTGTAKLASELKTFTLTIRNNTTNAISFWSSKELSLGELTSALTYVNAGSSVSIPNCVFGSLLVFTVSPGELTGLPTYSSNLVIIAGGIAYTKADIRWIFRTANYEDATITFS